MKEKYRICLFNLFLEPSLDWFKEETLCLNISNGICLLETKCNLKHPNYDGKPYLWQYFTAIQHGLVLMNSSMTKLSHHSGIKILMNATLSKLFFRLFYSYVSRFLITQWICCLHCTRNDVFPLRIYSTNVNRSVV